MLQQHDVETGVVEWKVERARGLKRHALALSRTLRQIARGINKRLAEIDAGNPAAVSRSEEARRPADSRSDIEN